MHTPFRLAKAPAFAAMLFCAAVMSQNSRGQEAPRPASAHQAFTHRLPALDGAKLAVHVVEVSYPPAGASSPHSHPCPVIGYVIDGSIRTQVKGEREAVYKTGQSFYEAPNGVHQVSANASKTEGAKFLAIFVCDHDAPLSSPAAGAN